MVIVLVASCVLSALYLAYVYWRNSRLEGLVPSTSVGSAEGRLFLRSPSCGNGCLPDQLPSTMQSSFHGMCGVSDGRLGMGTSRFECVDANSHLRSMRACVQSTEHGQGRSVHLMAASPLQRASSSVKIDHRSSSAPLSSIKRATRAKIACANVLGANGPEHGESTRSELTGRVGVETDSNVCSRDESKLIAYDDSRELISRPHRVTNFWRWSKRPRPSNASAMCKHRPVESCSHAMSGQGVCSIALAEGPLSANI